ncbi:NAD-dependent aldehyde dehydrogenase [Ramaria rubella]|nr:NAD-dependent aldehyde dehydrogenase [Ramaria rubella]
MANELRYTPIDEIAQIHEHLRSSFRAGKAKSIAFRKEQLLQLAYMLQDNVALFQESLKKDLGRPVFESRMTDVFGVISEALYAYKNVDSWVKPEKPPFDVQWFAFSPVLHKEAKGVALIISPFNYPVGSITPITGAIAAGCAVVVKPSEKTPATSQLLAELFPRYMNSDLYRVLNGGVEETTELLSLKWDHILYTGNGTVGRIIATAAARHLTPVTLELGGKSPVIVDSDADFELAARRILWGKTLNAGQTCLAPDYLLIPQDAQAKMVDAFKRESKKFFGDNARTSGSFSRICTDAHWERINGLLSNTKGNIAVGGDTDRAEKYIAPTIVQNVSFDDSLMTEEIFGPILPIIPVPSVDAAIQYINEHDHPLAIYVFSNNDKLRSYVRERTLSGSFLENDTMLHGGSPVLPFGGVGASGYGSHRGKFSFDTFTHGRSSFHSPKWIDRIMRFRFPPYTETSLKTAQSYVMPPIPYPRPGDSKLINWKPWVLLATVLGLGTAYRQRPGNLLVN